MWKLVPLRFAAALLVRSDYVVYSLRSLNMSGGLLRVYYINPFVVVAVIGVFSFVAGRGY